MKKYLILIIFLGLVVTTPAWAVTPSPSALNFSALLARLKEWLVSRPASSQPLKVTPASNHPPILLKVNQDKDAKVKLGQEAIWQVYASDPDSDPLVYSATWGDEDLAKTQGVIGTLSKSVGQMTELRHTYLKTGLHQPVFTIADGQGGQIIIQSNLTVTP